MIINMKRSGSSYEYWKLNFGKRNDEELYEITKDPECMNNLAVNAGYNSIKRRLHNQLYLELLQQGDPRSLGYVDIFDKYPYAEESVRDFYNRYMKGEISRKSAGWVDSTDFETKDF